MSDVAEMLLEDVEITTADGIMLAHVARPEGTASLPGVIVYMPASGIRAELVDIASRIASLGFVTVLPNLYYRLASEVDIDPNRLFEPGYAPARDYMIGLSQNITNRRVVADTAAVLDFLDARNDVTPGPNTASAFRNAIASPPKPPNFTINGSVRSWPARLADRVGVMRRRSGWRLYRTVAESIGACTRHRGFG
ncbi:MAG: hypothetical protein ACI8TP_004518 [Acidimicrobiales bacterium]